jgi:hypothetical protein
MVSGQPLLNSPAHGTNRPYANATRRDGPEHQNKRVALQSSYDSEPFTSHCSQWEMGFVHNHSGWLDSGTVGAGRRGPGAGPVGGGEFCAARRAPHVEWADGVVSRSAH